MTTTPVPARPSASLVIGRDRAAGWEILMALRNQATAFAGGALVFPGGGADGRPLLRPGHDALEVPVSYTHLTLPTSDLV